MKIFVPILFSLAAGVFSNPRQAKEIAQRRQFIGYTSNIVHENLNYPDQAAQSSVKVNFNQADLRKPVYSNTYQQTQPYTPNYPTSAPQSQLFNVGYSVRFTNGNKQIESQPKYTKSRNLEDGEIITGTRKQNEEVEVPSIDASPQEYVSAALIKKQKISGIKPKPHYIANYPNPKVLLSQANLSPNTQKYYKALEQLKPQVQNTQELQQKYSWRSLSPGVEIIRSTEIPTGQRYTKTEQTGTFDHARALGRSQDFDYTNAVDSNNTPQQSTLFYNGRKPQPQPEKIQQIPVVINPNVAKLPLDTTLLREQIPIQVDTRYIEEAMRNQAILYNPKYPQNQEIQGVNYLQQAYRTLPVEESQTKPVQVVFRPEQAQGFQEYQPDQNRFQLKIYGKPQPLLANFNEDEEVKRQPRYLVELPTNLRPPPFDLPFQRRIRVG